MTGHVDLRSWTQRSAHQIPHGATLTVLAADPWTGNVWVGWHDDDGTACRAMVHESNLDYADPFKRKRKGDVS
jgi:hypothetical protein